MDTLPTLLFIFFVAYVIYRRFFKGTGAPRLTTQDTSFAKAAVQEGLATIGYATDRSVDSPADAMKVGLAIASKRDVGDAAAVSIVALGIAENYISNKSMTRQHIALLMNEINEITADTFSVTSEALWDYRGSVVGQNMNAGFLLQKSSKNAFSMSSECRQSDVLAQIVLAVSKDDRAPVAFG